MAQRAKSVENNTYNVCNCIVRFSMILHSTTPITNVSIQKHETATWDKGKKKQIKQPIKERPRSNL